MENNPLVSIVVITYNSSKYVIETLESAKAQTYENIELIVSDDCSTDNTVEFCREWIEKNKERFVRTELLTVPSNTGIPANCNRGYKAAKGEWIKGIAGDDILANDCVSCLMKEASKHKDKKVGIVGGNVQSFAGDIRNLRNVNRGLKIGIMKSRFGKITSSHKQYELLLMRYIISTPTFLVAKQVYDTILYDEKYPRLEDYPFALNVLNAGYLYVHANETVVYYRFHLGSVSAFKGKGKCYGDFYLILRKFYLDYRREKLPLIVRLAEDHKYYVRFYCDKLGLNKNIFICKVICEVLFRMNIFDKISDYIINRRLAKLAK